MVFPFAIKYNKALRGLVTADNRLMALYHIKTYIEDKKADHIVIEKNKVRYKGTTSNWKGALFGGVDNGTFNLTEENGISCLVYEISMRDLLITTFIMGIAIGVFSQIWWIGLVAFLWLGGMNWLINAVRHGVLASEIADNVSDLFFEKEKKAEEPTKDESLKSWM